MTGGEHYIRGLSDSELEKVVGLNRDMYTQPELQIADDEAARRRQARIASAKTPASKEPTTQSRNTRLIMQYNSKENTLRRNTNQLSRSAVDKDYCMPPPEEPETKTYLDYGKQYARRQASKVNRSVAGKDYRMPPPEEPQKLGDEFICCSNCGYRRRRNESTCNYCGQKPY